METALNDPLHLYEQQLDSRLILGTALYPSPQVMQQAIATADVELITLALRRQDPAQQAGADFWQRIQQLNVRLLPNTAGCHSAREAITLAHMAREMFDTHWIKLEVIGDDYNLQPDPFELLTAATELSKEGFAVFPYCTDDLVLCQRLIDAGCQVLMPWGAPIGTGQGLINPSALRVLRERLPADIALIVDAGIGLPSHAAQAMELGYDAVLLNTAVAEAQNPPLMARAFAAAVQAGRQAYRAGAIAQRPQAKPSTPVIGTPFWHHNA